MWLAVSGGLLVTQFAGAESVERLAAKLHHSDFRVRTQAALALGATGKKAAVKPLCAGLGDSTSAVRAAAAAALGKLNRGGQKCLAARAKKEPKASVREVIARSIDALHNGGSPPGITGATKYYIAIGETLDGTGRSNGEVERVVRSAMQKKLQQLDGYAVAPAQESVEQGRELLEQHSGVSAFFLAPKVQALEYSNGNLTVRIELAIFSYPGKALKGMLPVRLTQTGVSQESRATEDQLVAMAVGRATEKFDGIIERLL